LGLVILLFCS